MIVFVLVGPLVERAWGSRTLVRFLILINVLVFATLFVIMVGCYAVTDIEAYIFQGISGVSGLNAALSVALKQRWPDRPLVTLPASLSQNSNSNNSSSVTSTTSSSSSSFSTYTASVVFGVLSWLKLRHIPSAVVLVAVLMWSVGSRMKGVELLLVLCGVLYGWMYLRFYFVDPDTKQVGDLTNEEFSFASFFPNFAPLRAAINFVSTIVFHSVSKFGFASQALKSHQQLLQHQQHASSVPLPVAAPVSSNFHSVNMDPLAERRRQLAIKAIDEKLAELSKQPVATSGIAFDNHSINMDLHELDAQLADGEALLTK